MAIPTVVSKSTSLPQAQPAHTMELGDLLVSYLRELAIDYVFGVPGGAIEPLYNALARSARDHGPRAVVARHECGAAFMADGYYRRSGKLGVCCATTGPGATNLITGVASAYENRIPMLVITAQTALRNFGRGALQESSCTGINTLGMFQHCTRYNSLVSSPEQFEHKLVSALMAACGPLPGPAHLSIPLDLLRLPATAGRSYDIGQLLQCNRLLDPDKVTELIKHILQASKLVFVIGESCGEAASTLQALASMLGAALVATPHGKGLVNASHPQYRGILGFAGHDSARQCLLDPQVDSIIVVGAGLGEWSSNGWDSAVLNSKLIHVDHIVQNFTRSPMAKLHVLGNLRAIFDYVFATVRVSEDIYETGTNYLPAAANHATAGFEVLPTPARCPDVATVSPVPGGNRIHPRELMLELPRLLPAASRYVVDSGNGLAWAVHYLHPRDRRLRHEQRVERGLFFGAFEFASMGWAIGAAIGMALAGSGDRIVCITGDGSLLMSGQEITVAIEERLPMIFLILNDSALGMVKHGQRLAGAEATAYSLPSIDFAAYARSMGAAGQVIRNLDELRNLDMAAVFSRSGPTVLDVRIDGEAVPPIATRMKILGDQAGSSDGT